MAQNLFGALQREWAACSATIEADRVLAGLVAREPVIAAISATDLGDLFARLDRRAAQRADDPWAVIAALIRQLGESELVSVGLLVVLIPMMLGLGNRFGWGHGESWMDREEFVGDLVAITWDVLAALSGATLAYPLHAIQRRVLGRLERLAERGARARRREVPTLFDEPSDAVPLDPRTGEVHAGYTLADEYPIPVLDSLARALCEVEGTVLDRELVQLVYAHRVLGYPISEISVMLGAPENAVEYRARCAEVLLCAS